MAIPALTYARQVWPLGGNLVTDPAPAFDTQMAAIKHARLHATSWNLYRVGEDLHYLTVHGWNAPLDNEGYPL